jgi:glucan phosphoethanolaminetransferase (alkaline phosphatase superfamily)
LDKVYINKSEINSMFEDRRKKAGPILTSIVLLWMLISFLLFGIPAISLLIILLIIYLPFYPLDKILGRKNNGNTE